MTLVIILLQLSIVHKYWYILTSTLVTNLQFRCIVFYILCHYLNILVNLWIQCVTFGWNWNVVTMVDCVSLPLSLPIGCVSLSTFVLVVVTPGASAAAVSTNPVVWFLTVLVVEPLDIIPGKQSLATFLVVFCALAGFTLKRNLTL